MPDKSGLKGSFSISLESSGRRSPRYFEMSGASDRSRESRKHRQSSKNSERRNDDHRMASSSNAARGVDLVGVQDPWAAHQRSKGVPPLSCAPPTPSPRRSRASSSSSHVSSSSAEQGSKRTRQREKKRERVKHRSRSVCEEQHAGSYLEQAAQKLLEATKTLQETYGERIDEAERRLSQHDDTRKDHEDRLVLAFERLQILEEENAKWKTRHEEDQQRAAKAEAAVPISPEPSGFIRPPNPTILKANAGELFAAV